MPEWEELGRAIVLLGAVVAALRLMLTPLFRAAHRVSMAIEKVLENEMKINGIHGKLGEISDRIGMNGDDRSLVQRLDDFQMDNDAQHSKVAHTINSHALDDQAMFEAMSDWAEETSGKRIKLPKPRYVPIDET